MNRRFLGFTTGVDVLASGEGFVDPGEAEAAIQGGSFEGSAVTGEGDALGNGCAASEFDICFDAVGFQVG